MSRTVAIIGGTGPAGRGLALRWARAGETVIIGSRDAERANATAAEIQSRVPEGKIWGAENAAACSATDVVMLTVPFEGQAALLKQLKPALKTGTIVIDATVPLAASVGGRATRTLGIWQGSAAQQTAELVPADVSVVSAFQNISAELLNGDDPVECDIIVCSDNPDATKIAIELAIAIPGVRAIDGGKLENSRIVEQITALLIGMNIRHKGHAGVRLTGLPDSAFRSQ